MTSTAIALLTPDQGILRIRFRPGSGREAAWPPRYKVPDWPFGYHFDRVDLGIQELPRRSEGRCPPERCRLVSCLKPTSPRGERTIIRHQEKVPLVGFKALSLTMPQE